MQKFELFYSNVYQLRENRYYKNSKIIFNKEELAEIVRKFDYTPYKFIDGMRGQNKNPECTSCLIFDVDNDHSDNSMDWITVNELVHNQLDGIECYYFNTKSHMSVKHGKKSARPRFRLLFPIIKIWDCEEIKNIYETLLKDFFYFADRATSIDIQRFYFAYENSKIIYIPGESVLNLLNNEKNKNFLKEINKETSKQQNINLGYVEPSDKIHPGSRNTELVRYIGHLLGENKELIFEEIFSLCVQFQKDYFTEEYPEKELRDTIRSLLKKENRKSSNIKKETSLKKESYYYSFDDIGDAQFLCDNIYECFAWCEQFNAWLIYNGTKWERDDLLNLHEEVKKLMSLRRKDISKINKDLKIKDKDEFIKKFLKHIKTLMYYHNRTRVIKDTRSLLPVKPEQFDNDDYSLNFKNGFLDLNTMKFRENRYDDYCLKCSEYEYLKKEKTSKKFLDFINQIFVGDEELINYVQKLFGYAITGSTALQEFYILHGTGKNGKDQFMTIFRRLFKDWTHDLDAGKIMENKYFNHDTYLAQLKGVRTLFLSESTENARLNIPLVKQLTSDCESRITVAQKYEKPISFSFKLKCFLVTNHLPIINDDNEGVWRRIRPIPFLYTVPDNKRILDYGRIILNTGESGIINWFIEGWIKFKEEGLKMPKIVEEDYLSYQEDSDKIGKFINDMCIYDKNETVKISKLYNAYLDHSGSRYEKIINFSKKIYNKGFKKIKKADGNYIIGLKLKEESLENTEF